MALENVIRPALGHSRSNLLSKSDLRIRIGLRGWRSRRRRSADSCEVVMNLDVAGAGPPFGLGWEAGIRTPIPWSRERFTLFRYASIRVVFRRFSRRRCGPFHSVSVRSRAVCLIVSHLPVDRSELASEALSGSKSGSATTTICTFGDSQSGALDSTAIWYYYMYY